MLLHPLRQIGQFLKTQWDRAGEPPPPPPPTALELIDARMRAFEAALTAYEEALRTGAPLPPYRPPRP